MPSVLMFALVREPHAPATARARTASFLSGLPQAVRTDVTLALTELVSNAVRHGRGRAWVEIHRYDDRIRIEVVDDGDAAPAVRKEPPSADGGWGLRMVDAVSTRWGAFAGTTHVWCEIGL
jgi:signal transduction histidine kinase